MGEEVKESGNVRGREKAKDRERKRGRRERRCRINTLRVLMHLVDIYL